MSEFTITPNLERKTARFRGCVAAGEHASVRINGLAAMATNPNLRFRVISPISRKMLALAEKPEDGESPFGADGNDLVFELNLNTTDAQKEFREVPELSVCFVLDDSEDRQMFFADVGTMRGWPQEREGDVPEDLDNYRTTLAGLLEDIDEVEQRLSVVAARGYVRISGDKVQAVIPGQ